MIIRAVGLVLLSFLLQSTIAEDLTIYGGRPDFIILVLVYLSLAYGSMTGMLMGFSVGLLQDFYGPASNLGLNALCKTLICFGIGLGKDGLYRENILILLSVLCAGMLVHDTLFFLIDVGFDSEAFFTMMWRSTTPSLVYTGFLGAVLAIALVYRRGSIDAKRLFPE